ncbi:hypothetical protein K493DRAFT_196309, partial [Basidiobolus meristosporus CBS 931.73]
TILASVASLTSFAFAGLFVTNPVGGTRWTLGTNTTIQKVNGSVADEKFDVTLMFGKADNLDRITTITRGVYMKHGSYKWMVPSTLAPGKLYVVRLGSGPNASYSHYFEIQA